MSAKQLALLALALSVFGTNASNLGEASASGQAEQLTMIRNALLTLQSEFDKVQSVEKDDAVIADPQEEKEMEEALAEANGEVPEKKAEKKPASLIAKAKPVVHEAKQPVVANLAKVSRHNLRSAQQPLADVNQLVKLKSGKQMGNAAFQEAITNLFKIGTLGLSAEELEATPFGGSVKKIKELIEDDMMPKVVAAHKVDQDELNELAEQIEGCHHHKDTQVGIAKASDDTYKEWSPKHKTCRQTESGLEESRLDCWSQEADKNNEKRLICEAFAKTELQLASQNNNVVVVTKGGSEQAETYLRRISATFCGKTYEAGGGAGLGGFGKTGFLDEFMKAKNDCGSATEAHATQKKKCQDIDVTHKNKKKECDNLQDQMDENSCKYAVDIKDSCEEYEECYASRRTSYDAAFDTVKINEHDRKAEWTGLKKMKCLVIAFTDGKVEQNEIDKCKNLEVKTTMFDIDYPHVEDVHICSVPKLYPTTAEYKEAEFADLPPLAKGKEDANECTGVLEISTEPASGSPDTCKCERLTLNGPFSPGPIVRCVDCLDVRRTADTNSCPDGTKIFSPRSKQDWTTFLSSAEAIYAPNFIIDITRGEDGTEEGIFNSINQPTWETQDGSPWWMRSALAADATPNGNYHSNCYLDIVSLTSADEITFDDKNCDYHAKSYYCQLISVSTDPKVGSPIGCLCEKVELAGHYSAKSMVKCIGCLEVSKSTHKNSCPKGTKLFAPASREDWKTFLASAAILRDPNFIIDITRPQNGCGGCDEKSMNSDTAEQATWKTADGAPWWLRSQVYEQPLPDYQANCYMDIGRAGPIANENTISFVTDSCNNKARSYYCQLARRR